MSFNKKIIAGILTITLVVPNMLKSNANENQLEVHHINVGQGESIYIEFPNGDDMLIDAGKSSYGDDVVNYLKTQESNIDIEHLIATHPDSDHTGGMQNIFTDLKIKNFYYPKDAPHDTNTWKNVLNLANIEGCTIKDGSYQTNLNIGGVIVKFIQPEKDYSDNNEDSIVTYLDYKNAEFIFTGDIEAETEKDMLSQNLINNIDFISVPHHGSKYSSTLEFVKKSDPEYAVVSVGENSYGHPTNDALNKYLSIGTKIYRTDKLGNIVIKTDGNSATINGEKVNLVETENNTNQTILNDIKGHWAESNITNFISNGYINGYADGTFKPNNSITRAEFIKIFNKYFGLTKTSGKVFNDTKTHWAKTEIDIAVTNGVANGVSKNEFNPDAPITREQAATMISNYKNLADSNHEEIYNFKDKNQISSWAKDAVEGVVERSYMNGYSDKTFKAKSNITRAEAVVTLSRVHKGAVPPVVNTPVPAPPIEKPNEKPIPPVANIYVYANGGSSSSKKYHKSPTSHGMKDAVQMTESQAKSKGYTACKVCF